MGIRAPRGPPYASLEELNIPPGGMEGLMACSEIRRLHRLPGQFIQDGAKRWGRSPRGAKIEIGHGRPSAFSIPLGSPSLALVLSKTIGIPSKPLQEAILKPGHRHSGLRSVLKSHRQLGHRHVGSCGTFKSLRQPSHRHVFSRSGIARLLKTSGSSVSTDG